MKRGSLVRLTLLAALWGSSFLWIKLALRGLSPVELVLARLVLGASVLLVYCRIRHLTLPRGARRWTHIAVTALVANSVPYLLFAVGEQTVASSMAGTLNTTTPLWTAAFALAVRQERGVGARRMVGLLIGFSGALLVMSPWHVRSDLAGAVACLGAAACYAISYVYTARYLTGWGIDPIAMVAAQLVAATVPLIALLPVTGIAAIHPRADVLASLAVLGFLGTGVAYSLNYRLTVDDGPTAASTVTYLLPVMSVLLGVIVLGEKLSVSIIAGLTLALLGVTLVRRAGGRSAVRRPRPGHSGSRDHDEEYRKEVTAMAATRRLRQLTTALRRAIRALRDVHDELVCASEAMSRPVRVPDPAREYGRSRR